MWLYSEAVVVLQIGPADVLELQSCWTQLEPLHADSFWSDADACRRTSSAPFSLSQSALVLGF